MLTQIASGVSAQSSEVSADFAFPQSGYQDVHNHVYRGRLGDGAAGSKIGGEGSSVAPMARRMGRTLANLQDHAGYLYMRVQY